MSVSISKDVGEKKCNARERSPYYPCSSHVLIPVIRINLHKVSYNRQACFSSQVHSCADSGYKDRPWGKKVYDGTSNTWTLITDSDIYCTISLFITVKGHCCAKRESYTRHTTLILTRLRAHMPFSESSYLWPPRNSLGEISHCSRDNLQRQLSKRAYHNSTHPHVHDLVSASMHACYEKAASAGRKSWHLQMSSMDSYSLTLASQSHVCLHVSLILTGILRDNHWCVRIRDNSLPWEGECPQALTVHWQR